MEPLDPALAELIATETKTVAPPEGAKARAWAAIGAGVGVVPLAVPAASAEAATAAAAKTGAWLKIVGATALVGAVGTGVWATSRTPEPTPAVARTDAAPSAEDGREAEPPPDDTTAAAVAAVEAEPEVEPEPEPDPEPESAPTVDTSAPAPEPRATKKLRQEPSTTVPTPPLGLAEELALVEKIRKAVAAGDHGEALTLAKEHRDTFPKGALRPDRLDLEATAYCARGQTERGRKLATQLRETWPKAPISDRLESTCKLDEEG